MPSATLRPNRAPRTICYTRGGRERVRIDSLLYPERDYWRPRTRGDCSQVPRPCPFVGCRYHLFLEEGRRPHSIRFEFGNVEPYELVFSCALDLAELDGLTMRDVAAVLGVSYQRVQQIEWQALAKIARADWRDYANTG